MNKAQKKHLITLSPVQMSQRPSFLSPDQPPLISPLPSYLFLSMGRPVRSSFIPSLTSPASSLKWGHASLTCQASPTPSSSSSSSHKTSIWNRRSEIVRPWCFNSPFFSNRFSLSIHSRSIINIITIWVVSKELLERLMKANKEGEGSVFLVALRGSQRTEQEGGGRRE